MATITLRSVKGSALTFAEGDANFNNLNTDKIELTDLSVTQNSASGSGTLSYSNSTGVITYTPPDLSSYGTLSNVSEDTTPQLGGALDGQGNEVSDVQLDNYKEVTYTGGTTTGTITPDVANGNVQVITLSGNITFNAFGNAEAGQSMTLIVKQPASGGPYTLTSTMKFAGGTKTLSTAADAIDIISVFYDGTTYYASLATNFS